MTNRSLIGWSASVLLLAGCLVNQQHAETPVTAVEREIDAGLNGIEYRLRFLDSSDHQDERSEDMLAELRRHQEALRRQLDQVILGGDGQSDSTGTVLRARLEDLAIRYETARLGRFESRAHFEEAVEARFEDLDRELALLEVDRLESNQPDSLGFSVGQLYHLRNVVALKIAEAAIASDVEFPRLKSELAAAIGRLDIMIGHVTTEIDRAWEIEHPIKSINKLWL